MLAFAQLQRRPPPEAVTLPDALSLDRFYVDARWHGHGLAARLLAGVIDAARAQGAPGLWLTVWERNPRAIAFYLKNGFVDVGQAVFVVGDDRQTDRLMQRRV